jgi:hypothetical protein
MNLSPLTKKIEVEVGYKGFYKRGSEKYTVTVHETGVSIEIDARTGFPASLGRLERLFKTMLSLYEAKALAQRIGEPDRDGLVKLGFVEVRTVEVSHVS